MKMRVLGVLALAVAVGAFRALYAREHLGPLHSPTALEFLLAAIGFVIASAGLGLVLAGRAVFEPYDWPSLAHSPWRAIFRTKSSRNRRP